MGGRRILAVPTACAGMRLDRFLSEKTSVPSGLLFKLLRKREITQIQADVESPADTMQLQGNFRVQPGMQIQIPDNLIPSPIGVKTANAFITREFAQKQLPVLHESTSMVVFQKPFGLASQGGTGVRYSVADLLGALSTPDTQLRLTHRLDQDTTGCLVVAKTRTAAQTLTAAFRQGTISKSYNAVLCGLPDVPRGTIRTPLLYNGKMTVALRADATEQDVERAKQAITEYSVVRRGRFADMDVCVARIAILTGRKHQIRAHCSQVLGCPVLGDAKYAKGAVAKAARMHLHLAKIIVP
ncbi:hypothetical protein GGF46_002793 [Coemansia sp. RSA 552]|nr:hypothetical protein GGF46_002869 [Coemansia sp. RSA 552]KAJ2159754.1 hypothetical protein GGF46_002793 [Coemansia sp. RSA 552]